MKRMLSWAALGLVMAAPVTLRLVAWAIPTRTELSPEAVASGKTLFTHEFLPNDPLCAGGDGIGPVFNAKSCVACHHQGGAGGGGGVDANVITFLAVNGRETRGGMIHKHATSPEYHERYVDIAPSLPDHTADQPLKEGELVERGRGRRFLRGSAIITERNTPALFGARLIDEQPDRVFFAMAREQRLRHGAHSDQLHASVGRMLVLADGRVGKFGWRAQTASLFDFVQGACANELGLSNPGAAQPVSMRKANPIPKGFDLTNHQCREMTQFIASLDPPVQRLPKKEIERADVEVGRRHFAAVGCAECHVPNFGSIAGIYSDLLLHRMGQDFEISGEYYPSSGSPQVAGTTARPDEWRTPPLWGVADSAPYLHDGRAKTLDEAIRMHGGQAGRAASAYASLGVNGQRQIVAFLQSLKAP